MNGDKQPDLNKILSTIGNMLSVSVIVLILLDYIRVINNGLNYALPLVGIRLCIRIYQSWNEDRDTASLYTILVILMLMVLPALWLN